MKQNKDVAMVSDKEKSSPTKKAVTYILVTFIGSFLFIFIKWLLLLLYGEEINIFNHLIDGGEVILVCIPLCVTILYNVSSFKMIKENESIIKGISIVTCIALFICIVVYSSLSISDKKAVYYVLLIVSILVFLITVFCLGVSKYFETKIANRDRIAERSNPIAIRTEDGQTLESKVIELTKKG